MHKGQPTQEQEEDYDKPSSYGSWEIEQAVQDSTYVRPILKVISDERLESLVVFSVTCVFVYHIGYPSRQSIDENPD